LERRQPHLPCGDRAERLQGEGAPTGGATRAEARRHIRDVVAIVVAELIEDGETLPTDQAGSAGTLVSVTV
jgi:predicted RNase H-like HicB family nuclease